MLHLRYNIERVFELKIYLYKVSHILCTHPKGGEVKKYILSVFLILFALACFPVDPAQAEHFDQVFQQHEQCINDCEDTHERDIESLPCDLYGTRDAYQRCQRAASAIQGSCLNVCNGAEDETILNCETVYRDEKKTCRSDKREETQECREAKKVEKDICKLNKIEEKEACQGLSGNAKRECKKQARQTKKACKVEAREDKKECKADAKNTRLSCITEAENVGRDCRNVCNNTYASSCTEESRAYEACAALAAPIDAAENRCKGICDADKAEALVGYNPACLPGKHAGTEGATITFYNATNQVRHYYRPEPFPETQPTGPLTTYQQYVTSLNPGESYEQKVICGYSFQADFKDRRTDGSDFVGSQFPIGPYPCCENAVEQTLVINP
jgi:hypothetical protein